MDIFAKGICLCEAHVVISKQIMNLAMFGTTAGGVFIKAKLVGSCAET